MSHKITRAALLTTALMGATGAFAAAVTPLGTPMEDALSRGSLLALAVAGLLLGVAVVRRKQGR